MLANVVMFLLVLATLYYLFAYWASGRPREVFYHTFWSRILRLVANHMQAMTLWNWTVMLQPNTSLSVQGRKHEDTHVAQFAAEPYLFLPKYLLEQIRHGYAKNIYEQAARAAAGEPLR